MADNDLDYCASKVPSLQQLCARSNLDSLLSSPEELSTLASYESGEQEAILRGLRTEIARLRDVEEEYHRLKNSCPRLDIEIYTDLLESDPDPEASSDFETPYKESKENCINLRGFWVLQDGCM